MFPKVPLLSAGYLSSCAGAAGGHVGPRQGLAGSVLERGRRDPKAQEGNRLACKGWHVLFRSVWFHLFFPLVSCANDKEGQEVE